MSDRALPPWLGDATAPGRHQADSLRFVLPPPVLALVREATRPTQAEVAALLRHRRRPGRRRVRWLLLPALLVAAALGVARLRESGTTVLHSHPVQTEAGLLVLSPGVEAYLGGAWVRGSGTVREVAPGHLEVSGALELELGAPTVLTFEGQRFAVGPGRVRTGPQGITIPPLPEGAAPSPGTPPARPRPPREPPAPEPAAPAADVTAWMEILEELESGEAAASRLEQFIATHPDSRYAAEARALILLVGSASAEPRLMQIEQWLGAHPGSPRSLELRALAAQIARDELRDCARARPHDEVVAREGAPAARAVARAFLGLCASAEGRADDAQRWFDQVDLQLLDPELRGAVSAHRRR
jgi:hypothetical protein